MPVGVWPTVVQHLPLPWSDEQVRFDLLWLVSGDGNLPSRRELATRWGWTEGQVRTLLRHPERWR